MDPATPVVRDCEEGTGGGIARATSGLGGLTAWAAMTESVEAPGSIIMHVIVQRGDDRGRGGRFGKGHFGRIGYRGSSPHIGSCDSDS